MTDKANWGKTKEENEFNTRLKVLAGKTAELMNILANDKLEQLKLTTRKLANSSEECRNNKDIQNIQSHIEEIQIKGREWVSKTSHQTR